MEYRIFSQNFNPDNVSHVDRKESYLTLNYIILSYNIVHYIKSYYIILLICCSMLILYYIIIHYITSYYIILLLYYIKRVRDPATCQVFRIKHSKIVQAEYFF